jgi:hypothetical protein
MALVKSELAKQFDRVNGGKRALRDIASITGEVGAGKTYFTLTGRGPIVVFNIDRGLEGVAEREEFADKEIYQHLIEWSLDDAEEEGVLQEKALDLRNTFLRLYKEALKLAGTIVIDTESRLWQLYRYAEFGAPGGDMRDYDKLNQRYEDFINLAKSAPGVNLFLIRSMKDSWNTKGTGKLHKDGREVWGYEHLPGIVMSELFFRLDPEVEVDESNEDPNYRYVIDVGKCRHNLRLQHTTVPRCSFPQFGRMLVEGSKVKDWL